MDMFEEIYEVKKELPKFSTISNKVKKHKQKKANDDGDIL